MRRRVIREDETKTETTEVDIDDPGFEVRDGDVLRVTYAEVKLPLRAQFAVITIGGEAYTRQLRAGDDVVEQYDRIYEFLRKRAERDAVVKVKMWNAELGGKPR